MPNRRTATWRAAICEPMKPRASVRAKTTTRWRATASSGTRPCSSRKHDRKTIYYGGNFIFKSTDQGDNWKRISPDVTSNVNRKTLSIMGKKVEDRTMLSRNDGVAEFPTVTTLSESPIRAGILWAGTDDGNLQVTRDGETWKSVIANVPGRAQGHLRQPHAGVGLRSLGRLCFV